ncbi:MAG TPA: hypothetical protein VN661_08215 [Candidatus Acidoferrales bacterium]|nr:hypothetical protein [Candidatus Acidoferrales bacterium]
MILLAKIALGIAAAGALGAAVLCSEGFVNISVVQTKPESHHVHIIAPAMIAPVAMRFIPRDRLRDPSGQLQASMPEIRAALDSLRHAPDMALVEVTDPTEHVRISKSGGSIVVDVRDPDDTVHVSVPLRTISSVLEEIAARATSR